MLHLTLGKDSQSEERVSGVGVGTMAYTNWQNKLIGAALGGDVALVLEEGELAEGVSKAELDAAAEGEFFKFVTFALKTAAGEPHNWAGFEPVITPSENVADGDVGVPTIEWRGEDRSGTPAFIGAGLALKVIFDTGATKVYQVGTKSTGDFTCVAKASVTDGGVLTLTDALGTVANFEADPSGDGASGSNVPVDLSAAITDVDVADKYREVINAHAIRITASGSTATVALEQDDALVAGDTTVALDGTMTGDGFTKTDFSGGADRDNVKVAVDASGAPILSGLSAVTKEFYVVAP